MFNGTVYFAHDHGHLWYKIIFFILRYQFNSLSVERGEPLGPQVKTGFSNPILAALVCLLKFVLAIVHSSQLSFSKQYPFWLFLLYHVFFVCWLNIYICSCCRLWFQCCGWASQWTCQCTPQSAFLPMELTLQEGICFHFAIRCCCFFLFILKLKEKKMFVSGSIFSTILCARKNCKVLSIKLANLK